METAVAGPSKLPKEHPLWLGGAAASMAVVITHPIDQTKIRTQVQRPQQNMIATVKNTVRSSGVLGLWTGLSGSLLRQATYSTMRFGAYNYLKDRDRKMGKKGGKLRLVANGALAGALAGLVGSPAELVMVRISSDGVKPPESRYNYKNALQGLYRIYKDEGPRTMFKGMGATVARSVVMNGSQLSCYDMIKQQLITRFNFTDTVPTHLLTSILGGTIAVTACAPIDVFKSRIQSAPAGVTAMSIITKSLRREGLRVLFRGWLPAWLRMSPTTMLTFTFFEQLKKVF
ncbi:mitochondrial carrier domain-containing protein [Kockovaella imperatae]|uniref:Mitochondrial carrier domain-containing protein n=1 Tax=Kockovaella imperatae TaxID=4999 RepID=A0A1Y1U5W6_9TREE|nr:mitochondrial carrier domain-containing protein [Kockovaella imperatae]ORX33420.1 mitochondrial carrier domain-containing protein [Kockovaella imperatae]